MNRNSEQQPSVSGEITPDNGENNLEHLDREPTQEASANEKREARIIVNQRLLAKKEEELIAMDTETLRTSVDTYKDKARSEGVHEDLIGRIAEQMQVSYKERQDGLQGLIGEIQKNITKLESGEDSTSQDH